MPEFADIEEMTKHAAEVVISGLSGRFPDSDNVAEFREHLINGDDMTTDDDRRLESGLQNYLHFQRETSSFMFLYFVVNSLKVVYSVVLLGRVSVYSDSGPNNKQEAKVIWQKVQAAIG